ncbi:hypothetical protein CDL15_Pgr026252 [Punica granatum]|uniref:Myb/SANT-like domain-containing protein n=1 Tax=Punica granatum TaxID=22663 RepID=A0A218VUB7_PUNGR|nr:hypothetical protein CDL15_Pgr026252 [Punica granatum]
MNLEIERQFFDVQLGFLKLQHKTTRLMTMYKQFTELLHHTGVSWDEDTNTIKPHFKPKPKTTPPESKRSKSVSSSEKLEKNSIEEAMAELNQLKPTILIEEYMAGSIAIIDDRVRGCSCIPEKFKKGMATPPY